ncbi:hypothetical protein BJ912DRAFT_921493 [Pholiota molesta]|nr:hypothetical protein BJ912DRAFT_921493 [Pholiota molesta]
MPVPENHRHLFQHNPYPPPPPPPALAHRVWILDCRSCGRFLTNRGMKHQAVLLLRPNVSLYSSDALPVNCSAYSPDPPAPKPAAHKPPAPRAPANCPRCTASITATNRATNGHRFVFHSNEVIGVERRYITDEPGVIPFDPPHSPPLPNYQEYAPPPGLDPRRAPSPHRHRDYHQRASSPAFRADYLPTPPLEFATPSFLSAPHAPPYDTAPQYPNYRTRAAHASWSPPPLPRLRYASASPPSMDPHAAYDDDDDDEDALATPLGTPPPPLSPALFNSNSNSSFYPADHKEPPHPLPSLKRGDVVFWHHLARSGEISGVAHDERARRPASPARPRPMLFNR